MCEKIDPRVLAILRADVHPADAKPGDTVTDDTELLIEQLLYQFVRDSGNPDEAVEWLLGTITTADPRHLWIERDGTIF